MIKIEKYIAYIYVCSYLRRVRALNSMINERIYRKEHNGNEKKNDRNTSPVIYAPFLFVFGFNHLTANFNQL